MTKKEKVTCAISGVLAIAGVAFGYWRSRMSNAWINDKTRLTRQQVTAMLLLDEAFYQEAKRRGFVTKDFESEIIEQFAETNPEMYEELKGIDGYFEDC